MRLTKKDICLSDKKEINKLTLLAGRYNDSHTASDFCMDIFSLLSDGQETLNSTLTIHRGVSELYSRWHLEDINKSLDLMMENRSFMKKFVESKFYTELKEYDPMTGLSIFLDILKKEDDKKDSSNSGDNDKSEEKNEMPIDTEEAEETIEKIDKIIESGILHDEETQDSIGKMGFGDEIKNIELSDINKDLINKLSSKITKNQMLIFKIARHKELLDNYKVGTELHKSEYPEDEMTVNKISDVSELIKTLPEQLAMDDDVFLLKLSQKELLIRDYQRKKQRKQSLYMLIDVSASMNGLNAIYASATALAFVRQAVRGEAEYFLRFFDFTPSKLYRVSTKKEAESMVKLLLNKPYSGGGTNIDRAIKQAVTDIKNDEITYDKSEIMLITDGECSINIQKENLKDVLLHTTIINGTNPSLKRISTTFEKINTRELAKEFDIKEQFNAYNMPF